MCARTKPKRTTPVAPITTFFPMVEPKKVPAFCMSSPCACHRRSSASMRRSTRHMSADRAGRAQQGPQEEALERGLPVDPVVVGRAEERLRSAREGPSPFGPLGLRQVASRGRWRASPGRRRPPSSTADSARVQGSNRGAPRPLRDEARARASGGSRRPGRRRAPDTGSRRDGRGRDGNAGAGECGREVGAGGGSPGRVPSSPDACVRRRGGERPPAQTLPGGDVVEVEGQGLAPVVEECHDPRRRQDLVDRRHRRDDRRREGRRREPDAIAGQDRLEGGDASAARGRDEDEAPDAARPGPRHGACRSSGSASPWRR